MITLSVFILKGSHTLKPRGGSLIQVSTTLMDFFDGTIWFHQKVYMYISAYMFAQWNDSGTMHLYVSYNRQPFNLAKIPSTVAHVVSLWCFGLWVPFDFLLQLKCIGYSVCIFMTTCEYLWYKYFYTELYCGSHQWSPGLSHSTGGQFNLYLSDITGEYSLCGFSYWKNVWKKYKCCYLRALFPIIRKPLEKVSRFLGKPLENHQKTVLY